MKERLTRHEDEFPCRLRGQCSAEEWMMDVTGVSYVIWEGEACDTCPFINVVNKLAEYEDMEEIMEDDLK